MARARSGRFRAYSFVTTSGGTSIVIDPVSLVLGTVSARSRTTNRVVRGTSPEDVGLSAQPGVAVGHD